MGLGIGQTPQDARRPPHPRDLRDQAVHAGRGLPALWEWEINDDAPPNTSIVQFAPNEIPLDIPVGYTVSSNELDADFECALDPINPDAPEYSGCATADNRFIDLGTPEAGEHTLYVRAIDPSLNVDPTPAIDVFTVVGPAVTTFTEGPVGAPLPLEPATTPHRTATFAWDGQPARADHVHVQPRRRRVHAVRVADDLHRPRAHAATRSRCSPRTGSGSSRSRPPRTTGRSPCPRARSSRTPTSSRRRSTARRRRPAASRSRPTSRARRSSASSTTAPSPRARPASRTTTSRTRTSGRRTCSRCSR